VFGRREAEAVRRLRDGADAEQVKSLGTAAVIDASFDVSAGEIFVVMGLSGSGKSTLIRTLNGLWKPSYGKVYVGDVDITSVPDATLRAVRREQISMVFQHFALLPHRTVRENAAYALEQQGVEKAKRLEQADHWLDVVGLNGWGDKLPGQLSGGMQQRVGLARALAAETDILLMDEAFSALDPLIRREMQDQLIELQSSLGKTIVFITHDLNEAMYVGDRIAVMRSGKIVQIGTSEEILTDPANEYVAKFIADVDRSRVLTAASVMEPPSAVIPLSAGPHGAVNELRQRQAGGVLVVDRDRRLLGYVTDDDAMAAVKAEQRDLTKIIKTDRLNTVQQDTPVAELFAPSADSPIPLAVLDDNGRLRGVIPRVGLLASLASFQSEPSNGAIA
jgi:glycine betaine/proline transport system ATP-binding protein